MTKKRKIIYIFLIILLTGFVLFFYNAFNGNPLSKQLAKNALKQYLEEAYPGEDYNMTKPFYNFKDSAYTFAVNKIGEEPIVEHDMSLRGNVRFTVISDGIYNDRLDEGLMRKLGEQASASLESLFVKDWPELVEIYVHMEVLKDTFQDDVVWTPSFQAEYPMQVHIVVDAENLTEARLETIAKTIQQQLEQEKYVYDFISINANKIINGEVDALQYAISFEPTTNINGTLIEQFND